MTEAHLTRFTY